MTRPRRLWLLPVSIIAAPLLGLLPLPPLVQPLRPYWLALVVAFWVIEEPDRAGLGFAFAMGVIGDLAFGGILGEQALRLVRSEEHTSELQSLMRISYAVFCLKKKITNNNT